MNAKHQSEMSELMSNADSEATRLKYTSGTSELVGSEQRHELRAVETPVELPASPDYYFPARSPDGKAVSELGSPGPSELSAGTFRNEDARRRESGVSGPGSPRSLRSFGTNSGFGTSPVIGQVGMQRSPVLGNVESPTLGQITMHGRGLEGREGVGEGGSVSGSGRNPRFVEEGLGIVTSNVEWARGVDDEGRRIYRDSK
jgi:hypothetical protein